MHFEDLNLIDPLLRAVRAEGYVQPTPIQERSIPHVLAGRDLLGCAQTGTGKTAAFALPILQRLVASRRPEHGARHIRVLVLSPTRELATQIGDSFGTYGKHTGLLHTVVFGGVGQDPQVRALKRGVDILVATPGRLLDLMNQGLVPLGRLEIFVLDEADRMLDMGFIHDVRRVITALPKQRQTLFFSATMPADIQDLANSILTDPVRVEVTPVSSTAEKIDQSVYFVEKSDKRALLEHVLRDGAIKRVLVFTRTKHGANRVAEQLDRAGVRAEAIHGNKSQNARERALGNFKSGATRVLVATDIAARGIDIDGITHVVNFDLPNVPESYVHRIGRTARAGASGVALSFCDGEERAYLVDIERTIRMHVPVVAEHPFRSPAPPPAPTNLDPRAPRRPAAPAPARPSRPAQGGGSARGGAPGHARGGQGGAPGQARGGQGGGRGPQAPRAAGASRGGQPAPAPSGPRGGGRGGARPPQGGGSRPAHGGGSPGPRPNGR